MCSLRKFSTIVLKNNMNKAFWFVVGVIVTIVLFVALEDPLTPIIKNFVGKFLSEPAIELSITETKLVEGVIINDANYLFSTFDGYGTLTAIQNIDDAINGRGVINPDFILCEGNCSAFSIYITNSSPKKAKNVKLEFFNSLIKKEPVELIAEERILNNIQFNNCAKNRCTLNVDELKKGDEILLTYLGNSNEFNSQCSVDGNTKHCLNPDFIDTQAILIFPDLKDNFRLIIDSINRPLPPLEESSEIKCYKLDTKSYIWLHFSCYKPFNFVGNISINKSRYKSKLESIIGEGNE